jgi:hypothetical protein
VIFTMREARAIARGAKTQARGHWRPGQYKVGHDYPVRTPRRPTQSRLKVTGTYCQRVGDITYADALAEGHRTTGEFMVAWVRRHEAAWIKRELIDRVECYDDGCSIVDWILCERFAERHADTPVQVIVFERVMDIPRFMARTPVAGRSGDYVANQARAIDNAECVDEATNNHYAKQAEPRAAAQRESFRRALEAERQRRKNQRT